MSTTKLPNYLRTHRKRVGFTQKDISFLIGANHVTKISRYENFGQIPHLTTVLAYEFIFNVTSSELFGGLYEKASDETRKRAGDLIAHIEHLPPTRRRQQRVKHLKLLASETLMRSK